MKNTWSFLAIALAIVGMTLNVIFYAIVGGGGFFSFIYAISGLLLDSTKFSLVVGFVTFLSLGMRLEATITGITFIFLTMLSLGAGFGFLSNAIEQDENKNLLTSNVYESHQATVDSANARVETYAKYADASSADIAQQQTSLIDNELNILLDSTATNSKGHNAGTVRSRIGDCSGNGYYIRKYCPQVKSIEAKKEQQGQAFVIGHQQYLAALAHRDQALKDLSNTTTNNTTGILNSMFINAGKIFSVKAEAAKIFFMGLTALSIELVASILFFLTERLYGSSIERVIRQQNKRTTEQSTNQSTEQSTTQLDNPIPLQSGQFDSKKNNLKLNPKSSINDSLMPNPKPSISDSPKPSLNDNLKAELKRSNEDSMRLINKTSNKLFKEATRAIKSGTLAPSLSSLRKWKSAKGVKLTDVTIKLWQKTLNDDGLIEVFKLPNGLQTYRLSVD